MISDTPILQPPPAIAPIPADGKPRPFWSVMIPTYNPRADYLEQTLKSVLQQAPGPEQMQIEVVDDCSPGMDVAALVKSIAGDRMKVSQTPKNLGLAGCWNTCIERSRGEWVNILHQDDYVLPGFYQTLAKAAERHPEVSLLATRSFFVDKEGVISGVTGRLRELENGARKVDGFFYSTPIQCPGVAVRRSVYEAAGGFRPDLKYTLDCEMWARATGSAGGLVTSEVLSCYRTSGINESERLSRTAEGLHDHDRLHQLFTERYTGFDPKKGKLRVCNMALGQANRFIKNGDAEAFKANMDYWKRNAPAQLHLRRLLAKVADIIFK